MANSLNQQTQFMGNNMQPQFREQVPMQFPYGNSNYMMNNPYDNYMGRQNQQIFNQNQSQQQYLKCRPVSSKEEARAFQIDLDGSLWVFTDVGNEKIYTKQINTDGTATFKTYALTEDENPYTSTEYVTKDEFNKVVQTLMAAMQPASSQGLAPAQNNTEKNDKNSLINF